LALRDIVVFLKAKSLHFYPALATHAGTMTATGNFIAALGSLSGAKARQFNML